MDLGFETIGNATLICHDGGPILATDPWIVGDAYFGSWALSHPVPEEQLAAVKGCRYLWLSHGHPDHLSFESLQLLRDKIILLPDHVGGRIRHGLEAEGFTVHVMTDARWMELTPRLRVLAIADYNQDAVLLVDLDGVLLVNLNDAMDRGWGRFVRKAIARYERSFLLALTGYDADMMNYFDERGDRQTPLAAIDDTVESEIERLLQRFPARYFVPFSSMHTYQRTDSAWANQYRVPLTHYPRKLQDRPGSVLPAFVRFNRKIDSIEEINPAERRHELYAPEKFGDSWAEALEATDVGTLRAYLGSIQHLKRAFDFITVRVGGHEHTIDLAGRRFNRGIVFEAPRRSLTVAVESHTFDDLLIGNFMKTTLLGTFPPERLQADFTPYVTKYADNGLALSEDDLRAYFAKYRRRNWGGVLRHTLEQRAIRWFRSAVAADSAAYRFLRAGYRWVKAR